MFLGMQPDLGRQHGLPQKWSESVYLLDKKIYLKVYKNIKILSVQNRRVPNPGFWQNKVQFSRQSNRHTTPELQCSFWMDHHFTRQIQSHNAIFLSVCQLWPLLTVCLFAKFGRFFGTSERNLDPRFWAFIYFLIYRYFKYIFLSSRYIDSGHFCGNLCCRPKAGCISKLQCGYTLYSECFFRGIFNEFSSTAEYRTVL